MKYNRKTDEEKHSKFIGLWLTEEEYAKVSERAIEANMSVSKFIREVLNNKKIKLKHDVTVSMPDVTNELKELGQSLSSIGNNVNQITRKCNQEGVNEKYAKQLVEMQKEIIEIRHRLEKIGGEVSGNLETHIK